MATKQTTTYQQQLCHERILETERAEREQHTNEVYAKTACALDTFNSYVEKPQVFACGINSDTRLTPRQYKRAARGAGWEGHRH